MIGDGDGASPRTGGDEGGESCSCIRKPITVYG